MPLKEHPEYLPENKRLIDTIAYVNKTTQDIIEKKEFLRIDTKEAFVELDYLDSAQSYDRISLNALLFEMASDKYLGLLKAKEKPYFCRIDFRLNGSEDLQKLYIGKMALTGEDLKNPVIIDWRSPVASVYYDGRLGDVTYDSPGGQQRGKLHLKRQYTINDGQLENILDVDIATNDDFLQAALGENKDNRLQDIVSTIQAEQNEIIRADIYSPIIVQGVAGSGKTTIALHRIAYLIYTFEENFHPENFLIIAPNNLFLDYISEVLPELGVERVKQTTYIDLAFGLLGIKHKLLGTDEKLIKLISRKENADEAQLSLLRRASEFKGSLKFRDMIDCYVDAIEQSFIPAQDFCLNEYMICRADEIRNLFLNEFSRAPVFGRIPKIKKALSYRLKNKISGILDRVEKFYDKQIDKVWSEIEQPENRKEKITALVNARDEQLGILKKAAKAAVNKYIALLPKRELMNCYNELTAIPDSYTKHYSGDLDSELTAYMCNHNSELQGRKRIEYEDLAALLYLRHRLFGFNKALNTKYVVIDEAQDFSLFQIYTIKQIMQTELFTLLGDLAQGIHSYRGIQNWQDVAAQVFAENGCRYLTLEQSYRTTIEIMNTANEVLKLTNMPELVPAKPVVRHGDKPSFRRFGGKEQLLMALEDRIAALGQYKTVAVICKTAEECQSIKKLLDKRGNTSIKQLSIEDKAYEGGVVLVPSYLAKGLEFDAVLICSLYEDYSLDELDLKLLYVGMTRALHTLDFLCLGNSMAILNSIPGRLWA